MPEKSPPLPPRPLSPIAGVLSYLVPGLGQILQGRIGKGLLFFVALYGLFFYGLMLGHWKNVYLPDTAKGNNPWNLPPLAANVYNRLQFAGQFWIGVAAWPAIWQYVHADDQANSFLGSYMRTPAEPELNRLQQDSDKTWDLGWVYTVIAGRTILRQLSVAAGSSHAGRRRGTSCRGLPASPGRPGLPV